MLFLDTVNAQEFPSGMHMPPLAFREGLAGMDMELRIARQQVAKEIDGFIRPITRDADTKFGSVVADSSGLAGDVSAAGGTKQRV